MVKEKHSNKKQICLECQRLKAENEILRREIEMLKRVASNNRQQSQQEDNGTSNSNDFISVEMKLIDRNPSESAVTKESSLLQKIELFRSLFKGRDDVYAVRYVRKRDGNPGYTPACKNIWKPGICPKPKISCHDCSHKDYLPIDDQVIEDHFRGEKVIGVYPLLEDDHCWFIVIDFDKGDWQADTRAIQKYSTEKKLTIAIERSRSGKGAHIWFFFSEPIPAYKARKFGAVLITAVMQQRHEMSFTSYDRMIPAQDFLTKDGLGNLIALPLQGQTARAGNTCFVDAEFNRYTDQWYFLSHVHRFSEAEIDELIGSLSEETELGELSDLSDNEQKKPWNREKKVILGPEDFPLTLTVTLSNGIYIPTQGLSQRALNKMKRLAAFPNPEFYKKQAMRFSTWNTPRIIACHQEHDGYIQLPRGCIGEMSKLFDQTNLEWQINDARQTGRPIRVSFNGQLRSMQQEAADALIKNQMGVLCGTTAFGKTVTAISLIAYYGINTLVLVNSVPLMQQWQDKISQFLTIEEALPDIEKTRGRKKKRNIIGQLGGSRNDLHNTIDVVVFNSAISGHDVKDFVKDYGLVIVDECHHVAASTFEKILSQVTAKHIFGLSATPVRQDGKQPIVYMQCGPIVFRDDAKKQAADRPFSHILLPRFTSYQLPIEWDSANTQIQDIFTDLSVSNSRNQQIILDVMKEVENCRNVIILTDRKEHVERLTQEIKPHFPNVIALTGTGTIKHKREKLAMVEQYPIDQPILIVATGKYVGEGFDVPRLDTLFLVMPFSWKGTLAQYAGRLHRLYSGKNDVLIYDYVDAHVSVLERMYGKRLKGYRDLGYQLGEPGLPPARSNFIFDKSDYWQSLENDLINARETIWISTSTLTIRAMFMLEKAVMHSSNDRREIMLYVPMKYLDDTYSGKPELTRKLKKCVQNLNILVQPDVDFHCNAVIIDQRILWYGSLAPLGFVHENDSIMRIESPKLSMDMQSILTDHRITIKTPPV
ncbi:MAG: DEAD/DEAH box helicase family protein [Bacillota bacterium]|nr:DEAD/DEAH box helicase family protein [Bacillota bacterium]